jgi:hypothetical protein
MRVEHVKNGILFNFTKETLLYALTYIMLSEIIQTWKETNNNESWEWENGEILVKGIKFH